MLFYLKDKISYGGGMSTLLLQGGGVLQVKNTQILSIFFLNQLYLQLDANVEKKFFFTDSNHLIIDPNYHTHFYLV